MKFILPLNVSRFDGSVVEHLASMRGNPRSIPARSKNIFIIESSLISLGNAQLQVITFKQQVLLGFVGFVKIEGLDKNLTFRIVCINYQVSFLNLQFSSTQLKGNSIFDFPKEIP